MEELKQTLTSRLSLLTSFLRLGMGSLVVVKGFTEELHVDPRTPSEDQVRD